MNLIESQELLYRQCADLLKLYNEKAKVMQNLLKQGFDKQAAIVDKELTKISKEFEGVKAKIFAAEFPTGTGIIVNREDTVTMAEAFEYPISPNN